MKATFKSDEEQEIKRLSKALDMALFIFQLRHNSKTDFDDRGWQRVCDLLEEYNIDIDDLVA